jgi:hypothetical protein
MKIAKKRVRDPSRPPLKQQLQKARAHHERAQLFSYFAGAFTILPLARLWLPRIFDMSAHATRWIPLLIAALAGFVTQALYNRFYEAPEEAPPSDHDEAV